MYRIVKSRCRCEIFLPNRVLIRGEIINFFSFPLFKEPIGHLLSLVQDVLGKTRLISASIENLDSDATRSLNKFIEILNSLVDRFLQCELHHFELVCFTFEI